MCAKASPWSIESLEGQRRRALERETRPLGESNIINITCEDWSLTKAPACYAASGLGLLDACTGVVSGGGSSRIPDL